MSKSSLEGGAVAVCHSPDDRTRVDAILAGLREAGLHLSEGAEGDALMVFLSRSALADQTCLDRTSTAHAAGLPVVPVLLEKMSIPADLPAGWAAVLPTDGYVEAFDEPEERKRRGILGALAALGFAGVTTEAADAASVGAGGVAPQAARASSSSSARVVPKDPMAKTTASVVKTSTTTSRLIAFGGAAAATVLVVGAVVIFQDDKNRAAAPDTVIADTTAATSSAASAQGAAAPAEPRPTPEDIATGGARVRLASDTYPAGYPIPVRVEGMPGHDNDYVAIAVAGSPGRGEVRYEYLRGRKDADIVLRPVMKPGNYEVRLFFGNDLDRNKSEEIRYTTPLTITPADPITLTPDALSLPEGRAIRVSYDGLPGNDKDWLATAVAGSPDGDYIAYAYTSGARAGIANLPPLMKAGKYEIRVYFDDLTSDRTVQARIPIEVTPAPPVNIQLDANTYAPGADIIVSFNSMPGNAKDWFALARAGEDGYLTYIYTGGNTTGTQTFRAPDEPGAYEIRAYFDDATGDKTVRATAAFRIEPARAPPAP